ncbi:peptidase m15 family [Leptolyngbya sp. Heron Island J]|uniref:C39 family peptidase n=1 Tax=Leptolyngbya sp. Heron Island J TaxID=1385935 RepID=UPI0003B93A6B|nr:C39 family peptidase [Leptolyngbya sp. Heron Island J]ESA35880.1 peptidase m15 family [Leptolyngbya sp. Heron Island J]
MSQKLKADIHAEYQQAFDQCTVRSESLGLVQGLTKRMVDLRSHYEAVEKATTVPWWFVGILHYKEWNFREPALFEKQVAEVLIAKKYHQAATRTLAAYLWGFDLWNGFQDGSGTESSWVWGSTNVLAKKNSEMGAAGILKHLQKQGLVKAAAPAATAKSVKPAAKVAAPKAATPKVTAPKAATAKPAKKGKKKLPVMYFSQRDNAAQAHRTCNTASCWMGALYMKTSLWEDCDEDENADLNFYLPKVETYGDTTDHGAQTRALSSLGVDSAWHTTLSMKDVKKEIDAGRPVVLGVLHKGHVSSPRGGGHMILAVGYDDSGMFIHDPYGEMDLVNGGYPGSTDGSYRHYSYKNLGARFEVEGPGSGWGRLFKGSRK